MPPAFLTLAPERLPELPENPTPEELTVNHVETAGMYHALRARFLGLVEWITATERARRETLER